MYEHRLFPTFWNYEQCCSNSLVHVCLSFIYFLLGFGGVYIFKAYFWGGGVGSFFFFNWWDWDVKSELCTCKVGTLLLEPHFSRRQIVRKKITGSEAKHTCSFLDTARFPSVRVVSVCILNSNIWEQVFIDLPTECVAHTL
jgi:hypothetical protein